MSGTPLDLIRRLEALSFRTLPAGEERLQSGWVFRWSGHGSRRANSANALHESHATPGDVVDLAEAWYRNRQAPAIFRLTPLADPGVDVELAARGYSRTAPTFVMTAPIQAAPAGRRHPVSVDPEPSEAWLRSVPRFRDASPELLAATREQLLAAPGQHTFAHVRSDDAAIAAIGVGIHLDSVTTVYNMNTLPTQQRRGYGTAVLNALLTAGHRGGTHSAVLQVTADNSPAIALYRAHGFTVAYEYHYREPPAPSS